MLGCSEAMVLGGGPGKESGGGPMCSISSMGLPFLAWVIGSMSPGGGSSIVFGRSGWEGEVVFWPDSADGECDEAGDPRDGGGSVGCGVGLLCGVCSPVFCPFICPLGPPSCVFPPAFPSGLPSSSFPSGFLSGFFPGASPSLFGGCAGVSTCKGSMPFPARFAKAGCLLAEAVVNGVACWHDCGLTEGLRREFRRACDAVGSDKRPPARQRCGYRNVKRFVAMAVSLGFGDGLRC